MYIKYFIVFDGRVFQSFLQCEMKLKHRDIFVYFFSHSWLCEHLLTIKTGDIHTSTQETFTCYIKLKMRNKDHKYHVNKQLFRSLSLALQNVVWKTDSIKKVIILHCTYMWITVYSTSPNLTTWFRGPFNHTKGFFTYFFIFIFSGPPRNYSSLWSFPSRNMLPFFSIQVSGLGQVLPITRFLK